MYEAPTFRIKLSLQSDKASIDTVRTSLDALMVQHSSPTPTTIVMEFEKETNLVGRVTEWLEAGVNPWNKVGVC